MYAVLWDATREAVQGSSVKAGWVRINEYEGQEWKTKGKEIKKTELQCCFALHAGRCSGLPPRQRYERKRGKVREKRRKTYLTVPPNPIVIHPHSMYVVLWGGPGMPSLRQPGNMLKEEVRADTKGWEWKEERDDLRERKGESKYDSLKTRRL
jgi:hypothetical protein